MLKDDRSVIKRLDDIENKIPTFNYQEPKPISEVIGRPFSEYLRDAIIYGYEDDERKFKRKIKEKKLLHIIWVVILIPVLIFDIVSLIINKQFEWLLVAATTLALLCPILSLITFSKQKNKQRMRCFWNIKNIDFYLVNDGNRKKIAKEESNGIIFYILLITKIISTAVGLVCVLWYCFASIKVVTSMVLYWIGLLFGYAAVLSNVLPIRIEKPYYYSNYIIEADDSYVTYPDIDYFKK